jgi:apolipoprotein N-acyltransferase
LTSCGTVTSRTYGHTFDPVARVFVGLRGVVERLDGWRRWLLAAVLGAVAVAAFAPLHWWPILVPSFVCFYWLAETSSGRRTAFAVGWWFGFGHFAAGLYWIANAFLVRGGAFVWAAPFAVLALAAILALFPATAVVAWRSFPSRGIAGVLFFAVAWTGAEWARVWLFTGFPWNLIGSAWAFSDPVIQTAAWVGTLGLGLITVVAATMPAVLGDLGLHSRSRALAATFVAALVPLAAWVGGELRLAGAEQGFVDGVRLRLVQANIAQEEKWRRERLETQLAEHLRLSARPAEPMPTHIFWAETAAPLFLAEDPPLLRVIGGYTPANGVTVVGALRRTPPGEPLRIWNSFHAVDERGSIRATYDKFHLVPFGEYVPLRGVLDIAKLTSGSTDFSPGSGLATLRLPGLPPVGPLICYEVIFPGRVADRLDRPHWLLNLTNDAWYGISAGPFQHFAAARLRAVEEGLPLVRVANTGISAIVDPYGRIVASLGLGEAGVVDGPLPQALTGPPPYGRLSDLAVLALLLLVATIGFLVRGTRHSGPTNT